MASRTRGISDRRRVEAVFRDPTIYALGGTIPSPPAERGGRPRHYPHFTTFAWLALQAVYQSSRRVEAALADQETWDWVRRLVQERFPHDPAMWLRAEPMRRHHFQHARSALLRSGGAVAVFDEFERRAAALARELGLCDPEGNGSLTHPSLERVVYGDGKVVTPLYKAKPGDRKVDRETGEIRTLRADPDAKLHFTGSGEPAYGNKFVMTAVRSPDVHGRVILSVDSVTTEGAEAAVAVDAFRRVVPKLPGAQAVLYDGAFRGVHLQTLLNELGVLPVVPVHAATGGRRARKPRVERAVRIGQVVVRRSDGTTTQCQLYAEAGALCLAEPKEDAGLALVPLTRCQIRRRGNADGTWRWYGDYEVPAESGGGTVRVRLDRTDEDAKTTLNRTEHLRPIPPGDPDYRRLYSRRADAESINRGLDDSQYLTRAHSVGQERQRLDVLGYAIAVNALARARPAERLGRAA